MQGLYHSRNDNNIDSINFIWLKSYSSNATCVPKDIEHVAEWRKLNPRVKMHLWVRGSLLSAEDVKLTEQLAKQYEITIMDFDHHIQNSDAQNKRISEILNMLNSYGIFANKANLASLSLIE